MSSHEDSKDFKFSDLIGNLIGSTLGAPFVFQQAKINNFKKYINYVKRTKRGEDLSDETNIPSFISKSYTRMLILYLNMFIVVDLALPMIIGHHHIKNILYYYKNKRTEEDI